MNHDEYNILFILNTYMKFFIFSVLAYCQKYYVVLLVAVMIGFGKGLRTVFMALVIPTHVPLHKLPGATGIQLITAGMVYLTLGPVVGEWNSFENLYLLLFYFNDN